MKIENLITPKSTGYLSLAGFGGTVISGITKNKGLKKFHKPAGYFTICSTLLHIGVTEYYSYKYKNL